MVNVMMITKMKSNASMMVVIVAGLDSLLMVIVTNKTISMIAPMMVETVMMKIMN